MTKPAVYGPPAHTQGASGAEHSASGTVTESPDIDDDDGGEEGRAVYRVSGFHPVHLGDRFHAGKYQVLRKLGWGRYSTVWLVKNHVGHTFNALKILSAECYGTDHDVYEREILVHMRDADCRHPGYAYITTLYDSFEHDGPNGRHLCPAFSVMGETLSSFGTWFPNHQVPNGIMRRFTIQLLLALDYAHDSGVIHTDDGNIKPDNIFVQIPDYSVIESDYLPSMPSDPRLSDPAYPPFLIPTQPLKYHYLRDGANLLELNIALGDWGVSSWTDRRLTEIIQPTALRSPEVLIGAPWGPDTDLWNLGGVVMEVFRAVRLFSGRVHGKYEAYQHLHEMIHRFGPLSRDLLERGDQERVREWIDMGTGRVKDGWGGDVSDWPGLEHDAFLGGLRVKERVLFVRFLRDLMVLDPKGRKTAMELLASGWLDAVKR